MSTSANAETPKALDTADAILPPKVFPPAMVPRAGLISHMDKFDWREELGDMCQRYAASGRTFLTRFCFDRGAADRMFERVCGLLDKLVAKAA